MQVLLFAFVLLIALRDSPLPRAVAAGDRSRYRDRHRRDVLGSLSGSPNGKAAEDLWKTLILPIAAIMVVRRVLAKRTVTIQSIYGALSAYIILRLMFSHPSSPGYRPSDHD